MKSCVETVRAWRREGLEALYPERLRITVGMGTCGRAAGAADTLAAIENAVAEQGIAADVVPVGCRGACWAEPLVEVHRPEQGRAVYGKVLASDVAGILRDIQSGAFCYKKLIGFQYRDDFPLIAENSGVDFDDRNIQDLPFFAVQNRRVTGKCGHILPSSVEQYAAYGGYFALAHALEDMQPEELIGEVEKSGLRGRGGAGFPTGAKWRAVFNAASDTKYIIANADEGDPGAFMDRGLIEGDPHALIEGMLIAGYALGAQRGYVFIRSEYPLAIETLEAALEAARAAGILGESVMGTRFAFDIRIVKSAGAYVCGEATALVKAMEGVPGRPRKRPPHLAESGLWGRPTCLNNVETLANIAPIVLRGAAWFREVGTSESPGTKTFSIAGSINKTGLVEIPLGTPVETLLAAITPTAGDAGGESLKACQIGGPSGVVLPADMDFKLDFEDLARVGGSIGSGGLVFLGQRDCVVETVKYLTEFSLEESCGQCCLCQDCLSRCSEILQLITLGQADPALLDELRQKALRLEEKAFCGLGRMSARPILSSLRFFEEEYRAHLELSCPGMVCKKLISFSVIDKNCPGCRCCKPTCPTNAIGGRFGKPYVINDRLCIRCWMCTATCPYDAIEVHASAVAKR